MELFSKTPYAFAEDSSHTAFFDREFGFDSQGWSCSERGVFLPRFHHLLASISSSRLSYRIAGAAWKVTELLIQLRRRSHVARWTLTGDLQREVHGRLCSYEENPLLSEKSLSFLSLHQSLRARPLLKPRAHRTKRSPTQSSSTLERQNQFTVKKRHTRVP